MKKYYRVMLGEKSNLAPRCFAENFIGAGYGMDQDLSGKLTEDWRLFNREFIPVYLQLHPQKGRIAAGLACGTLWTIAKGIREGDLVLSPNGENGYRIGEVVAGYTFHSGDILPHQRRVHWLEKVIERDDLGTELRNSAGARGTVCDISKYSTEIERLISGQAPRPVLPDGESVEDPTMFALEKHLEDFLVENWMQTELGKQYVIYSDDGEQVGQQFPTDTGPIDILAISKDQKRLLVVELKKGRASDAVIGQVLRYMGFVQGELAEEDQTVHGVIIALEDDQRIRRALAMTTNIEFYRYQISFKLVKG